MPGPKEQERNEFPFSLSVVCKADQSDLDCFGLICTVSDLDHCVSILFILSSQALSAVRNWEQEKGRCLTTQKLVKEEYHEL